MSAVNFVGATGGAGTTTVAAAYALVHGISLWALHPAGIDTLDPTCEIPRGTFKHADVRDGGSLAHGDDLQGGDTDVTFVVVRGPSYTALRSIVDAGPARFDGVILVAEEGRALTRADVTGSTGLTVVAEIPVHPTVARAVDAALFTTRIPRHVASGVAAIRDTVDAHRAGVTL